MFPLKRSQDQDVRTEVSSRPSQTQVAGSGVEQVTGADDHSDTATCAPDCDLETDESLNTSQLEVKGTLIETKEEVWRATHGLGLEIREMMEGMEREMRKMQQGMGREISDLRQDMGREIRGMRQEICGMQKEMGMEMSEMQKEMGREMNEMQQKIRDISTTASHANISNMTSASGRSTEEGLQYMTTHLTGTRTILFLNVFIHVIYYQRSN